MGRKQGDKVPLYQQIYNVLRKEVQDGLYALCEKGLLPSEHILSDRFQVERSTIRKALQLLVDDNLVRRIPGVGTKLVSADDMARPSEEQGSATVLSDKHIYRQNNTILLVSESESVRSMNEDHYYFRMIQDFERHISAQGCNLMIKSVNRDDRLAPILLQIMPAAIIFASHVDERRYNEALSVGVPCVSVDYYTPLMTSIVINNFDSAYQVIQMLAEKNHEKIGIITGGIHPQSSKERLGGVRQCFLRLGREWDEKYMVHGDYQFDSGYAAGEVFLAMPQRDRPTAVFAFNDNMAYGCYSCFERYNVKVPREISIVGFDRTERFTIAFGHITTVDVNIKAMVEYSCWYLFSRLTGKSPEIIAKIMIDTQLVDYGSVASGCHL